MFFHRNDNDDQNPGTGTSGGESFPLLPLRDIIVFPHMVVPLFVGREKSINALLDREHERLTLIVTEENEPAQHLYASLGFRPIAES